MNNITEVYEILRHIYCAENGHEIIYSSSEASRIVPAGSYICNRCGSVVKILHPMGWNFSPDPYLIKE